MSDSSAVVWVLIEKAKIESDSSNPKDHAKIMRQHMDYLSKIHSEKRMLASISFQGGGGLMFFKSNTDSIKSWMKQDPAIQNNLFTLTYLTWIPEKGNICQTDKNSKLGNVNVTFISFSAPKDPAMREKIEKKKNKLLTELKDSEQTMCLGKMNENNTYAVISANAAVEKEETEVSKTIGDGIMKDAYKAWAPLAAFCD
ncbi:hypothetical protein HZR84_00460 [Hyphobacterium sp. CCMP332]|nr:hypothetical protein HZR84_00460 [Hyphobacterium sp. CCMP332]